MSTEMSTDMSTLSEVYSAALRGEACEIVGLLPEPLPLPVNAWAATVEGDDALLAHCQGACVDIGCGPGRMTAALAARGHVALGVDLVPEAVFQTRDRGVAALLRDVFAPLPGEGRWHTALLADGNIGIGGEPAALLRRVADLLCAGGRVVVDLAAPGTGIETRHLRLQTSQRRSEVFPWAVVGVDAIASLAAATSFETPVIHRSGARWFAVMTKGLA